MTIYKIIEDNYDRLKSSCDGSIRYSHSRTEEDMLQDTCLKAMKKYKNLDISEEEGVTYLEKTLFTDFIMKFRQFDTDPLVFMSEITENDEDD